jgi:CheY-like chemotaxis protein
MPDPARIPILIVEDGPEAVAVYRSFLKDSPFQMIATGTTREAEELLETLQPAAIILDIMLRSETSWSFLARLKADSRTRDIPVLVVSTIEDQAKGYQLGADRYLLKPIGRAQLLGDLHTLTAPPAGPPQIVIIDDEERDRYVLKQRLRNSSVSISEASSAEEGIRMALRLKPAVVFLDLTMPGMTGSEALKKLKLEPAVANIPVIIVTSRILSDSERKELMEGAFAILSKEGLDSVDVEELLSRVFKSADSHPLTHQKGAPE